MQVLNVQGSNPAAVYWPLGLCATGVLRSACNWEQLGAVIAASPLKASSYISPLKSTDWACEIRSTFKHQLGDLSKNNPTSILKINTKLLFEISAAFMIFDKLRQLYFWFFSKLKEYETFHIKSHTKYFDIMFLSIYNYFSKATVSVYKASKWHNF